MRWGSDFNVGAASGDVNAPRLSFRVPLDPARLQRARHRVRDYLHEQGIEPDTIEAVILAIEEAMTNAVRHSGATHDLEIDVHVEGADLVAEIIDRGTGFAIETFDPQKVPDVQAPDGRGLYLMARLMDDLELRCDGGLRVRVVKKDVLDPSTTGRSRRRASGVLGSDLFRDARQAALLEEIDEAYLALDWAYRCVYANRATVAISRRPRDQHLGRTLAEVLPGMPDAAAKVVRDAMELGVPGTVEFESSDVQEWRELRVYPTPFGVSVYVRDIDARKRRELERDDLVAALRGSERRYRELVQNTNSAIMRWSNDGTITFLNEYAQELFGWSADEAVGRSVSILVPEQDSTGADLTELPADILAHPERYASNTNENICRDGRRLWMTWTNRVVRDDEGQVVEVLAVGNDVTDLKRAEDALRASEESYRSIVEAADHALGLTRPTGGEPDGERLARKSALESPAPRGRIARTLATLREHPVVVLLLAVAAELAFLIPLGTISSSRQVLGLPGSLLALTVVIAGALAGPEVGVASALIGGSIFWLVVADSGAKSSLPTTVLSTFIWAAAALIASLLSRSLSQQVEKRRASAVALARLESAHQAQLVEQRRIEELADDLRRERAQTQAELEMSNTMLRVADTLASTLDLRSVLEAMADLTLQSLRLTRLVVVGYDERADEVEILLTRGDESVPDGTRLEVARMSSPFVQAVRDKSIAIVDYEETGFPIAAATLRDERAPLLGLWMPIVWREQLLGLVGVDEPGERHEFSEREIELVAAICKQAAAAIANAGLYEAELRISTKLQEGFVHPLPEIAGWEFGAATQSASEFERVGGDFHDVVALSEHYLAAIIGDVEGKGLAAAGLTETVRSATRALALSAWSPPFVLTRLNHLLLHQQSPLVTALFVSFQSASGTFVVASAGHPAPILLSPDGTTQMIRVTPGLPLGALEQSEYRTDAGVLVPGGALVFYTDGVIDARRDGRFFGEQELMAVVSAHAGRRAQEIADCVRRAVSDYADALRDDAHILVVRRAPELRW